MQFGELLGKLRKEAGLTQAGLADKAGLSARTVQSWEQGRRAPVSPDFFQLVKVLGVSADAFAGISVDKGKPAKAGRKARGKKRT